MPPPTLPDAAPLDGTESMLMRQGGKLVRALVSMIKGRRVERYTASVTGSAGQASITFSPAFSAAPEVIPVNALISGQLYLGVPSGITATGATLTFYRTKGTLLLTASAVEVAPAGTSISAVAIG